jgi:hypothetical protein
MFLEQQITGQVPSPTGIPRVPPRPPENDPVNRSTSCSSTPPSGHPSSASGIPAISLPMKQFLLPVVLQKTDIERIVDLPPLHKISYNSHDAHDECDDSSDLGGAAGKPPVSLKQTEFSTMQFAKSMAPANNSSFNKCEKVWVVGFFKKRHRSIIRMQIYSNQH